MRLKLFKVPEAFAIIAFELDDFFKEFDHHLVGFLHSKVFVANDAIVISLLALLLLFCVVFEAGATGVAAADGALEDGGQVGGDRHAHRALVVLGLESEG